MLEAMGEECQICGYSKYIGALEFHHLDPSVKEITLTKMLVSPASWDKIVVELRKCVLLCANCHREVHAGVAYIPDDKVKFNEQLSDYKSLKQLKKNMFDECPVCKGQKPSHNTTCSNVCSGKLGRKVDWDNIDLKQMLIDFTNPEQVGNHLGISGAAVRKRIKTLQNQGITVR